MVSVLGGCAGREEPGTGGLVLYGQGEDGRLVENQPNLKK